MRFFFRYLRQRYKGILVFLLFCVIFAVVFALYHLPLGAVIYPSALCAALGILLLALDCRAAYRKHCRLCTLKGLSAELMEELPPALTLDDADYQDIIRLLRKEQSDMLTLMNCRYADMIDYYTLWAHQIKTPIASIRLNQQNEDSEFSRRVAEDLQRIEQYVDMVLAFLRLDSDSTDYVFMEYDLDGIVRSAVKKFSTQFIRRRINLVYEPLGKKVVTDEKWLSFVVEQVLSNALKYTPSGTVGIYMEEPTTLCISDTGIGIAPEDLPRIFEKGYTGYNGRTDKKASGLGLYLCRRICNNLGHTISASSVAGEGTVIRICLAQRSSVHE